MGIIGQPPYFARFYGVVFLQHFLFLLFFYNKPYFWVFSLVFTKTSCFSLSMSSWVCTVTIICVLRSSHSNSIGGRFIIAAVPSAKINMPSNIIVSKLLSIKHSKSALKKVLVFRFKSKNQQTKTAVFCGFHLSAQDSKPLSTRGHPLKRIDARYFLQRTKTIIGQSELMVNHKKTLLWVGFLGF